MLQELFPAQIAGVAVGVYMLMGAFSGSIATLLLGVLGDHYKIDDHPDRIGYLLTIFVLFSYLGCFPCFLVAAHRFRAFRKRLGYENVRRRTE